MNSSSQGRWPSSTTPAGGSDADAPGPAPDGGGRRTVNREASDEGGGLEYVHPDGSRTRVGAGTASSLSASDPAVAQDGSAGEMRLDVGSLWHEADPGSPGGQSFDIHLPGARISSRDATFAVIVEADGSSFVTSVAGSISVYGADAGTAHVAPLEAAMLSSDGRVLDAIRADPAELTSDPWVGANLRRSGIDPTDVPLPDAPAIRFDPAPAPTAEEDPAPGWRTPSPGQDECGGGDSLIGAVAVGVEAADATPAGGDNTIDLDAALAKAGIAPPVGDAGSTGRMVTAGAETTAAAAVVATPESTDAFDRSRLFPEGTLATDTVERSSPARAIGGALLVLVGLVIVILVIRSLAHGDTTPATSTGTTATTAPATATTATPSSTSATSAAPTTAVGNTTAAPATSATTVSNGGGLYTVRPTQCTQTGTHLSAEGTILNRDTTVHSYRITVAFSTDGTNQVATATATVSQVGAGRSASWNGSAPYTGQLSQSTGGCRVDSVKVT